VIDNTRHNKVAVKWIAHRPYPRSLAGQEDLAPAPKRFTLGSCMNSEWFWPGLFIGGYIVFLIVVCRKRWRNSEHRLAYGISDMWAFIVGITPTLLLAAYVIEHRAPEYITGLALLGFGQFAGIFLALMDNNDSKRTSLAASFLNIIAGSVAGVGLAFIYVGSVFILAFTLGLIFVMAFLTYGLVLLPLAIVIFITWASVRRKKKPLRN
jgi:hypothetical protein